MRYLIGNEVGRWYIDPEARLLGLDAIDHLRFQARRLSSFFASELKTKGVHGYVKPKQDAVGAYTWASLYHACVRIFKFFRHV